MERGRVRDLDGDGQLQVRRQPGRRVREIDLSGRITGRHERHDPAHVEAEELRVKLPALLEQLGRDVRDCSPDTHGISFCLSDGRIRETRSPPNGPELSCGIH